MKTLIHLVTALSLTGLCACAASAQSIVAQSGSNPLPLAPAGTADNTRVLLATAGARTSDLQVYDPTEGRKNFFLFNFESSSDYVAWTVSVAAATTYQVTALLNAASGQTFSVSVNGSAVSSFTADGAFDRLSAGTISLPAGTSTIVITRTGSISGDAYFKSIELLDHNAAGNYSAAVTAGRADTTWFSQSNYGLMFQYGGWGFPNNVGPAKTLNQQATDFDVPTFVDKVVQSGASYVIWSISWWTYHMDAPLTSPNSIVSAAGGPSSPGLASSRDLIGEIAQALHAKGIRFGLYYHTGDEDTAWWPYQNFPTSFSANGTGDRSTFFNNWTEVVTEIGNRYGTNLDMFFFDDGVIYYPASFQALETAASAGNPNRLIAWNPYLLPHVTDFQDVYFGEGEVGQVETGSSPAGGNGIFTTGPQQGLLQHGMFPMDNDWGIHLQGQKIGPSGSINSPTAISWAQSASSRGVPLSFDMMMYEDGTVSDQDLSIMNDVRQAIYPGTVETVPTGTTIINDTSSAIAYSGSNWNYSSNRNAGDYNNDVHYTTNNGDSVSYSFTGTGVDVLGPKSNVSQNFTVSVDGVGIGTFSEYANSYTSPSVIYSARHLSPGTHTIMLAKSSGTYFQIDGFRVIATPTILNDTSASLSYNGTWGYSNNRGAGDYNDDVHYTAANGSSVSLNFTGSGIDIIGPMESIDGTANVVLDGKQISTIQATYSGSYAPQQHYWGIRNLTPGAHSITVTKTGGSYLQIDAVSITP